MTNSAQARDEGIEQVTESNAEWWADAQNEFSKFSSPGMTFTGEDLRIFISRSIGEPRHHNAWGALIMQLVRQGLISDTGQTRNMKMRSSHARRNPVWRVERRI